MVAVFTFNKLHGNPHLFLLVPHAALEDMADTEVSTDGGNVRVDIFEIERGGSRCYVHFINPGEKIENLFREAVTKIFQLGIATHVHQRQYGN